MTIGTVVSTKLFSLVKSLLLLNPMDTFLPFLPIALNNYLDSIFGKITLALKIVYFGLIATCIVSITNLDYSSANKRKSNGNNLENWWFQNFTVNSTLNLTSYHYFHNLNDLESNTLIVMPKINGKLNFTNNIYSKFVLGLRIQSPSSSTTEDSYFHIPNLYLGYKTLLSRYKIGWQTTKWGIMDGYSPMDVTNTYAYFEPLAPLRRGSLALSGKFSFGQGQLQLLFIPQQTPAILPGPNSRWLPRDIAKNVNFGDAELILPESIQYSFLDPIELDDSLSNNFGFNFQWHGDNIELNVMFFEGVNPSPLLQAQFQSQVIQDSPLILAATSDIQLSPLYNKKRTTGFGILIPWSPWIVKSEIVYWENISQWSPEKISLDIPSWGHPLTLGIERSFYVGSHAISMILEGYTANTPSVSDNQVTSNYRIFDHAVASGVRYSPSEQSSLTFKIISNTASHDKYYSLTGQTTVWDRLSLKLAFESFEGDEGTLLGTYSKNDRTQIQIEAYW